MRLDIRLAIGTLFTILGILLGIFGFFSNPTIYAQSLGINVNLWWGVVLLVFGAFMLVLGARAMFFGAHAERSALDDEKSQRRGN